MEIAIVTGSSGLIGSEAVKFFHEKGMKVIGIDNNMREYFFGAEGSSEWNKAQLLEKYPNFEHHNIDIRNQDEIFELFKKNSAEIGLVVHTAAQPSHDWAAKEPFTDFSINANGTLNLLEATRTFCKDAPFIFTSTNKVYGDTPNRLPLVETESRWELSAEHHWSEFGIDESMSIDNSMHSLFGASKVAADVLVQEYGRYFEMNTASFRGGCLTGPSHSGAKLHGFLSYLVKCAITDQPYTIFGYKGKQVRDNIHSSDLINAFWEFYQAPRKGEIYNIGGSRHSSCSVLEAIDIIKKLSGKELTYTLSDDARAGDHQWWISDVRKFQEHYPNWKYEYDITRIIKEIIDATQERFEK
ncbi:NAD-dependent epimerase/dehydratase family protein [Halobacteriovorax sp. HLS]|uniref:NAD-dependent epimerase/dehydratase family protein n=1 Tax=Halobacteriovorax sp. HLS TaxID=2234000 RepID=UPI000FDAB288|nr:NAD-dependent epimerase/dehydratase family protein [Halobacteriovorax sp. HLS]